MNRFGRRLGISLFGESHGPAIGAIMDGVPAGIPIDMDAVQRRMDARRPGTSVQTSQRSEPDQVEIMSGVHAGRTTGAPLAFIIHNQDTRSKDYDGLRSVPRPGHADLTEHWWSRGHNDPRGGGHRSGRLTAPWVAAAAILAPLLEFYGVSAQATLIQVGDVQGDEGALMAAIDVARQTKDSVGGKVRFEATGVPRALGSPMMDGAPSLLAHLMFAIPGVKAVELGDGVESVTMRGSQHNDGLRMDGSDVAFESNHAGGVLGGRTTGQPLWGHVTFKPTSSIPQAQHSVDLDEGVDVDVEVKGRHDPCIALRGTPVVRAAMELVLADLLMEGAAYAHVDPPTW